MMPQSRKAPLCQTFSAFWGLTGYIQPRGFLLQLLQSWGGKNPHPWPKKRDQNFSIICHWIT